MSLIAFRRGRFVPPFSLPVRADARNNEDLRQEPTDGFDQMFETASAALKAAALTETPQTPQTLQSSSEFGFRSAQQSSALLPPSSNVHVRRLRQKKSTGLQLETLLASLDPIERTK